MVTSIAKTSKSLFVRILVGIIILPFVFWGMGDVFRGGNQNIVASIDSEKISSQEFITYLNRLNLSNEERENISKSSLLETILSDYISRKVISMEIKDMGIKLSDTSLKNIIINDKTFFKEGKFSRTEYEKFLLQNSISAPVFEDNIVEQEERRLLLSYLSDGTKIPEFYIQNEYRKENQTKEIAYIDLNKIYDNHKFKNDEIKNIYNKNKKLFSQEYKALAYVELTPAVLTGGVEYDKIFFKEVDVIENDLLDGKLIEKIKKSYNLNLIKTKPINKKMVDLEGKKFSGIDQELFNKIFINQKLNTPSILNLDNKYYLAEVTAIENKDLGIKSKEVINMINAQLKIKLKLENNTKIAKEISLGDFNQNKMKDYAKKNNLEFKNTTLMDIEGNDIFNKALVKRIFETKDGEINLITNSSLSKNFIILSNNTKYQNLDANSKKFDKYKAKAKLNFAKEIYNTYDKSVNNKYNIDINNKVIDRIKNSF